MSRLKLVPRTEIRRLREEERWTLAAIGARYRVSRQRIAVVLRSVGVLPARRCSCRVGSWRCPNVAPAGAAYCYRHEEIR